MNQCQSAWVVFVCVIALGKDVDWVLRDLGARLVLWLLNCLREWSASAFSRGIVLSPGAWSWELSALLADHCETVLKSSFNDSFSTSKVSSFKSTLLSSPSSPSPPELKLFSSFISLPLNRFSLSFYLNCFFFLIISSLISSLLQESLCCLSLDSSYAFRCFLASVAWPPITTLPL